MREKEKEFKKKTQSGRKGGPIERTAVKIWRKNTKGPGKKKKGGTANYL